MNNKVNKNTVAIAIGALLIFFGVWQLFAHVFGTWFGAVWQVVRIVVGILWPLVIIGAGIFLVLMARKGKLSLPKDRKLYRSTVNKKLSGVCGGIAEYLDADPALVRVVTIVLAFLCWYVIVPLYLLFWLIIPTGANKNYNTWV